MNTSDVLSKLSPAEYERLKNDIASHLNQEFKVHPMQKFKDQIYDAKLEGSEWVETTPEVLNYYNPKGLGPKGPFGQGEFFVFDGVKVCLEGQAERLQQLLDTNVHTHLNGEKVDTGILLGFNK